MDSSAPARSGASAAGFLESGTSRSAQATPSTAIGTLIRNTDPHQNLASSKPPTIGPSAIPTPVVPAQMPIARWRSAGSRNMSVMIESVAGIIMAPPMPMLARAAISMPTEPENAAQVEPAVKATRPTRNAVPALGPAGEIIPPLESALSEGEEAPGYPLAVSGVFGVVRHEGTFLDPALAAQLEGEQGG